MAAVVATLVAKNLNIENLLSPSDSSLATKVATTGSYHHKNFKGAFIIQI
jgi:hypothetical protein